jgi:hypothetical protein
MAKFSIINLFMYSFPFRRTMAHYRVGFKFQTTVLGMSQSQIISTQFGLFSLQKVGLERLIVCFTSTCCDRSNWQFIF